MTRYAHKGDDGVWRYNHVVPGRGKNKLKNVRRGGKPVYEGCVVTALAALSSIVIQVMRALGRS